MKIANIIGARPQFIKYFPVSKAIEKHNNIHDILIHTGQHYDYTMSKIFFDELGIKEPEYHLGAGSGTHGEQTAQVIQKVEEVLIKEKPDIVMVYGDTNSTLGGALASSKLHIPVAHIEAGLRSYNKHMPEEINRVLTDHVSSILFCPTETAVQNLKKEGFTNIINNGKLVDSPNSSPLTPAPCSNLSTSQESSLCLVINTGDVMYDVILHALKIAENKSNILNHLNLAPKSYNLLTIHRAENTVNQERFSELIDFVNNASDSKPVIFPMHPRTKKVYEDYDNKLADNIKTIDPVSYFDILMLLKKSSLIMTDSGGMQKEAYWLQVPCITLRDETEWVETVQSGWNVLYRDYNGSHNHSDIASLYGDGKAAEKIVNFLVSSKNRLC